MNEITCYNGPKTAAEAADDTFIKALTDVMNRAHWNADLHGFWDDVKKRLHEIRVTHTPEQKYLPPSTDDLAWIHVTDKREVTVGEATIRIAQIHGELSEALDALNHGNPTSKHIESMDSVTEELADVIIRTLDLAAVIAPTLPSAILAKMKFNAGRPYQHGKTL